jgi:hypothetical protein
VDELAGRTRQRRRLNVVEHQVEGEHAVGRQLRGPARGQLGGDQLGELGAVLEAHDGHEVILRIQHEPLLAELAVEVDRQVRDAQERPTEVEQEGLWPTVDLGGDAAGDREVAVEPGVEQRGSVGLDAELPVAVRLDVGARLQPEVGRVGVCADDPEAALGRRRGSDLKGDDAASGANCIPARAGLEAPGLVLSQRLEAARLEPADRLRDRVVGRGRTIDEAEQIGDGVGHARSLATPPAPDPPVAGAPVAEGR